MSWTLGGIEKVFLSGHSKNINVENTAFDTYGYM